MNRIVLTVAAAVFGMAPATVYATTETFVPSSGVWNDLNNWSPTGVPTEADDVIIPSGKECTVDTFAEADTIVVEEDAQVIIPVSCRLTLDNDSAAGSIIELRAEIFLDAVGNAAPPVLAFVDQNHVVSGEGAIRGNHSSCTIAIQQEIVLTSQLATDNAGIRGSLTVMGVRIGGDTGTFINEGLVESTGMLVMHANTIIDDVDGALWQVMACSGGILEFNRQELGLEGDFIAECVGTLRFKANIKTCGGLLNYAGAIDIENSSTFQYATFSGAGCSNPSSSCGGSCASPCTVSADHDCGCTGCG